MACGACGSGSPCMDQPGGHEAHLWLQRVCTKPACALPTTKPACAAPNCRALHPHAPHAGPVVAEAIFLNREEVPVQPLYYDPGGCGWPAGTWQYVTAGVAGVGGELGRCCFCGLPVCRRPYRQDGPLSPTQSSFPSLTSAPYPSHLRSARLWLHAIRAQPPAVHASSRNTAGTACRFRGAGHPGGGQRLGRKGKGEGVIRVPLGASLRRIFSCCISSWRRLTLGGAALTRCFKSHAAG